MATPHLDAFIEAAVYFVGLKEIGSTNKFPKSDPRGAELLALGGNPGYVGPWCAMTVSACAEKAGAASIIKKSASTSEILRETQKMGGELIPGPYINGGVGVVPQRGDIITFGNASYHGPTHGYHIGLVEYVDDKVHTIEGNSSDECRRRTYAFDKSNINAYVRPNWAALGDDPNTPDEHMVTEESTGPLYENWNDRHDMTLRQVCYLKDYALTDSSSDIAISVINYTTMLGSLYDSFAPTVVAGVTVDTSQLPSIFKNIVDYLLTLGIGPSATSGIVGCLQKYSGLATTFSDTMPDGKKVYGLGAWTSDQIKILKGRGGTDTWNTNVSAQLQYLYDDLSTNCPELLASLKNIQNDEAGVSQAVELFIFAYNKYFADNESANKARAYAMDIFGRLIITQGTVVGDTATCRDINGNLLSAQYSIDIPGYVGQSGIIDDYTSYSHWYSRWNKRSPQKKLANLWGEQGFPCDKGVALIGGYYCVAVRPKFGRCGEVIVVTLDSGASFTCIICDEKGEDAGSEWGHVKKSGISLIEWERVITVNGVVSVTNTKNDKVDPNGFGDWLNKNVTNITNYGKYIEVGWS